MPSCSSSTSPRPPSTPAPSTRDSSASPRSPGAHRPPPPPPPPLPAEPPAALDARAEHEVFQRFAELTRGKTAVLISHRFSTVRMADRILVLEGGRFVEMGSHDELLAANGRYAELFRLQARGYQ